MISIYVKIHGEVDRALNHDIEVIKVEKGSTVETVLFALGIEVKMQYLFVVNKKLVNKDFELFDGAKLSLFPFVSGG